MSRHGLDRLVHPAVYGYPVWLCLCGARYASRDELDLHLLGAA